MIKFRSLNSIACLTFLSISAISCVSANQKSGQIRQPTSTTKSPQKPSIHPIAKTGSKAGDVVNTNHKTLEIQYLRMLNPNYNLLQNDLTTARSLDASASPLEEAIMYLTGLRFLEVEAKNRQQGYVARDLNPEKAEEPTQEKLPAAVVQTEIDRLGLKLNWTEVLDRNPFLQLPQIYEVTDRVVLLFGNPVMDRASFNTILQKKVSLWSSLTKAENEPVVEALPSPSVVSQEPSITSDKFQLGRYSLADLNRGDSFLRQAQKFAEKGEFKQAIVFATKIAPQDPLFPAAKEKIKEFSNQAVLQLRQKAARAFQSALPVADKDTKLAYLEQAKQFLVQALQEFPDADHLEIVKENLAVISKDLDNIDQNINEKTTEDRSDL